MIKGLIKAGIITVALSHPLTILSNDNLDSLSVSLDEIVVTATLSPKSIKDVPVVTRLISEDEIKKSNAANISDLLTDELPGLEFGYAMSQETTLNMGGLGGSAVLFLVDGERLAGETMDNIDYSRLNLEDVGRVEIVKGAASALYGANAVGGVVNLISKEFTMPWHANVNSSYGSAGQKWLCGGNFGCNVGKWNSNTSIQYTTANTINLTDAFDTQSKIHKVYGGTTVNGKERIIFRPSTECKFTGRIGFFHRTSLRDTYTDVYNDYSAGIKMNYKNLELSYSYDQYDKHRLISGINNHDHDYSNRQHIVHGLFQHLIGDVNFTFGADYISDYLASYQFVDSQHHSQDIADAFIQAEYSPRSWLSFVASVRDDYYSAASINAVTARVAAMLKFKACSLRMSYAGGFRAPTLKEMYMDFDMAGISMIYGNPDLKPERSHNFNLAVERNGYLPHGAYSLTISGNYNYYNNRITVTEIDLNGPNDDGAEYYNERGVKILGMDLTARYRANLGVGCGVSMNLLHVSDNAIDSQFSSPRPFSITAKCSYERSFKPKYKLYAALSGRYLSKPHSRYPTDSAYGLLDLTLQQSICKKATITLSVDNLLNYRPKIYYWTSAPTTGISWSIGASINLK